MGYGTAGNATVEVDIVQTDVDAIVDGLAGASGTTLTDFETYLMAIDGYLYDGNDTVLDRLAYIETNTYDIQGYLYYNNTSAAELLSDIHFILNDVWDSGFGALRTVAE